MIVPAIRGGATVTDDVFGDDDPDEWLTHHDGLAWLHLAGQLAL